MGLADLFVKPITNQQLLSDLLVFGLCASGISESRPVWFRVGLTAPRPSMLQTRGILPLLLHCTVGTLHCNGIPTETYTHRNIYQIGTIPIDDSRTHLQTKTSKPVCKGKKRNPVWLVTLHCKRCNWYAKYVSVIQSASLQSGFVLQTFWVILITILLAVSAINVLQKVDKYPWSQRHPEQVSAMKNPHWKMRKHPHTAVTAVLYAVLLFHIAFIKSWGTRQQCTGIFSAFSAYYHTDFMDGFHRNGLSEIVEMKNSKSKLKQTSIRVKSLSFSPSLLWLMTSYLSQSLQNHNVTCSNTVNKCQLMVSWFMV